MEVDGWGGELVSDLQQDLASRALIAEEVEELLIRIGVRYGTPLGNAQFASQCGGPIGKSVDTLAAIAVFADLAFTP